MRQAAPSSAPTIRAITFDVGGTLIDPYPSVGHIYSEVARVHGYPGISPALLNRRFAAAWRALRAFRYTRAHWAGLVDATFLGLVHPPPSRTFFPALYARFSEPGAWRVYDDVLPALAALAGRGLKLGLISNWDERLRPLLRGLNLSRYFDVRAISCEVGAAKPGRAIFRRAAARLRLPPEEILHVGDRLDMDVRGARAAGFRTRWLRRNARAARPGQLRSLAGLIESIYDQGPHR